MHELARGIDDNEVVPDRPTQSISVEDTFEHDLLLAELEPMIRRLAEKLWAASRKESRTATNGGSQTEDQRVQDNHAEPHAGVPSMLVRRIDGPRAEAAGASGPGSTAAFPVGWRWIEQLSGPRGLGCAARSFPTTGLKNGQRDFT